MESMEAVELVWAAIKKGGSLHEKAKRAVDSLIHASMQRRSSDNLTAIVLFLNDLDEPSAKMLKRELSSR